MVVVVVEILVAVLIVLAIGVGIAVRNGTEIAQKENREEGGASEQRI